MALQGTARVPIPRGLGFGAAQLGNLYRETSDEEARAAVDAAWDAGIRYFDTAPHYGLGLSERRLGRALAGRPRADYILSTKVGRALVPTPERAGEADPEGFAVPATHRREWDFSRDGVRRSIEQSLERLGTDRIDIAYLHDPDDHWEDASGPGLDALRELRDEGVVGAVGAGMNHTVPLTRFVLERDLDVVMIAGRWTLLDRSAADELLPAALERGVAVVAAGVYNSGLLSRDEIPDDARFEYEQAPRELIRRARDLAAICRARGVPIPAAAVQFPLTHPAVASVVIGMRTAAHVEEAVARFGTAIPDGLWTELS